MLMNSYETVNDVLVKLFNEIMDVEERALLTSESVSYTHLTLPTIA